MHGIARPNICTGHVLMCACARGYAHARDNLKMHGRARLDGHASIHARARACALEFKWSNGCMDFMNSCTGDYLMHEFDCLQKKKPSTNTCYRMCFSNFKNNCRPCARSPFATTRSPHQLCAKFALKKAVAALICTKTPKKQPSPSTNGRSQRFSFLQ